MHDGKAADERGPGAGLWAPQTRALTLGLVLTITFVASEALAVVTVMPVVARDLGGLRLYGWVFSGFMLGQPSSASCWPAGKPTAAGRRSRSWPGWCCSDPGWPSRAWPPRWGFWSRAGCMQGVGAGAMPSVAYASIGRCYPGALQARMMAVLSTAWVVPGLIGPAISAEVAHLFGWRWVFLGLLPVVAVAGAIAVPALLRLGPPGRRRRRPEHRPVDAILTAAGATIFLAGLGLIASTPLASVALILAGAAVGVPASAPAGARRAR